MFYVHLKYPMLTFMLAGLWPFKLKNRTLSTVLCHCLDGLSAFLVITITAFQFLEIPHAYHIDVNRMVSNIRVGSQFFITAIKCWTFRIPIMRHLMQRTLVTEQNILEGKNEEIKVILMKYVKMMYKINFFYVVAICTTVLIYCSFPFMEKYLNPESQLEFPLDSWFPFDKNEHYWKAYTWNVLGGLSICIYMNAGNTAYFGFMIFLIEQLEILKYDIRTGIDNTKYNHEEVHQNLRKIISYYKNIRKFVTDLNGILKFILLVEFVLRIAHIAMVGFGLMTDEMSIQLVKNVWYLLCTLIGDVVLLYWLGDKVFSQNCGVTDVIWESDWYNCNVANKKTILILMMQAQKPLNFDVTYSRILSLETLLMILKTSATYMITLKQFVAMKADAIQYE